MRFSSWSSSSITVARGYMCSMSKWNWTPAGGSRRKFLLSWDHSAQVQQEESCQFHQRCAMSCVLLPTERGSAAGSSPPRCSPPREAQLYLDGNGTHTNVSNCVQHLQEWTTIHYRLLLEFVLFEEEIATLAQTVLLWLIPKLRINYHNCSTDSRWAEILSSHWSWATLKNIQENLGSQKWMMYYRTVMGTQPKGEMNVMTLMCCGNDGGAFDTWSPGHKYSAWILFCILCNINFGGQLSTLRTVHERMNQLTGHKEANLNFISQKYWTDPGGITDFSLMPVVVPDLLDFFSWTNFSCSFWKSPKIVWKDTDGTSPEACLKLPHAEA